MRMLRSVPHWLGAVTLVSLAAVACGDDDDDNNVAHGGTTNGGSLGEGGAPTSGATAGKGGKSGTAGTTSQPAAGESAGGEAQGGVASVTLMRTDLVSDEAAGGAGGAAGAMNGDAQLINAWGISFDPDPAEETAFWVSAADSGVSTIYSPEGVPAPLVVTIPASSVGGIGSPTGQVYNETTGFSGDKFIFATEDGLIAGWKVGTTAVSRADHSADDASYKGLALVTEGAPLLLAANFHGGTVDVFDNKYKATTAVTFEDPEPVAGYAPFNVAVLGGRVYVAYVKQDAMKEDEVAGSGLGYVDRFEADGTFGTRLIDRGGALNAPWGMALAPSGFSPAPGALIVGNFGDGMLHAYDPNSGRLVAEFTDDAGNALAIDGLWALAFGPKKDAEDLSESLFFTAGPEEETHGVFGVLKAP